MTRGSFEKDKIVVNASKNVRSKVKKVLISLDFDDETNWKVFSRGGVSAKLSEMCQICNFSNTQFIVKFVSQSLWLSTGPCKCLISMIRFLSWSHDNCLENVGSLWVVTDIVLKISKLLIIWSPNFGPYNCIGFGEDGVPRTWLIYRM